MSGGEVEYWQGYEENGEVAGRVTTDEAARGALHGSAHVWIWRRKGNVLEVMLQRRSAKKRTWPNLWDISAAGHPAYGESMLEGAIRETYEEIGVALSREQLELLFVYRAHMVSLQPKTIENELQFVYGVELHGDHTLKLQEDEVESVQWVTLETLEKMCAMRDTLVPHDDAYFIQLFAQLRRYL
ncbi:hypothetical protein CSA80_02795 [Candidatus Saccharibacteria bacterium]|nr:MAG: hypothetical protein CR973_02910 [Candidatus Saccharibacteria bacterium]PID99019.1 MAG: hypothetical protein CSA80_02795 [Candidatus Saccharibacteria bacterium]